MSRILLTRQPDDNQRLAQRLSELGVECASLPLLVLVPLEEDAAQRHLMLQLDRYHVVIVVSRLAATLGLELLDRYWPQTPVGLDWLAVGSASAEPLSAFALPVQVPGDGQDSEALMRLPLWSAHFARPDLKVMIWRGVEGREHLAEQVRAGGGQVDYLELYRREAPPNLAADLATAVGGGIGGIVILSAQALKHWQASAGSDWQQQRRWRCWVPSSRVAAQAADLGCEDVVICEGADDAAIFAAVRAHPLKD